MRQHSSVLVAQGLYRYYEKWYYGAIRAVLDVERITDDYQALAALLRPAITPTRAREAVELLGEASYVHVRRDDGGEEDDGHRAQGGGEGLGVTLEREVAMDEPNLARVLGEDLVHGGLGDHGRLVGNLRPH